MKIIARNDRIRYRARTIFLLLLNHRVEPSHALDKISFILRYLKNTVSICAWELSFFGYILPRENLKTRQVARVNVTRANIYRSAVVAALLLIARWRLVSTSYSLVIFHLFVFERTISIPSTVSFFCPCFTRKTRLKLEQLVLELDATLMCAIYNLLLVVSIRLKDFTYRSHVVKNLYRSKVYYLRSSSICYRRGIYAQNPHSLRIL